MDAKEEVKIEVPSLKLFDVAGLLVVWAGVIGVIVATKQAPGAIVFGLLSGYYLSKLIITKKASL